VRGFLAAAFFLGWWLAAVTEAWPAGWPEGHDAETVCAWVATLDGIETDPARFWRAFCALREEIE
jgi:hypothetical protein